MDSGISILDGFSSDISYCFNRRNAEYSPAPDLTPDLTTDRKPATSEALAICWIRLLLSATTAMPISIKSRLLKDKPTELKNTKIIKRISRSNIKLKLVTINLFQKIVPIFLVISKNNIGVKIGANKIMISKIKYRLAFLKTIKPKRMIYIKTKMANPTKLRLKPVKLSHNPLAIKAFRAIIK